MKKELDELFRIARANQKAYSFLGNTIKDINEDVLIDSRNILEHNLDVVLLGVKNTSSINRDLLKKLLKSEKYIWHTIDNMSDGGRAVDINLINPITGRVMTGSSSATAINVLYGINDIGIGTDGGGSVIGPALSLNLFSILAKGLGLKSDLIKESTDSIKFSPGVGFISHDYNKLVNCLLELIDKKEEVKSVDISKIKVGVCKYNNFILPDGIDMRVKLDKRIESLKKLNLNIKEFDFKDTSTREDLIYNINKAFEDTDVFISYEGPVDLEGLGDSVFGTLGPLSKAYQNKSGKYLIKVANMVNATAITIPSEEIGSGIVILAKEGLESGLKAIKLAEKISRETKLPDLYYRYFKNGYLRRRKDLVFEP